MANSIGLHQPILRYLLSTLILDLLCGQEDTRATVTLPRTRVKLHQTISAILVWLRLLPTTAPQRQIEGKL